MACAENRERDDPALHRCGDVRGVEVQFSRSVEGPENSHNGLAMFGVRESPNTRAGISAAFVYSGENSQDQPGFPLLFYSSADPNPRETAADPSSFVAFLVKITAISASPAASGWH